MNEVLIVIQARTGSTRLPGKILLPLAGEPLLARMIERVAAAGFPLMVATTTDPADDPVVALCRTNGVSCFRGHPTDLLDRHLGAARQVDAGVVVKIPSDCPLIDPAIIGRVVQFFMSHRDRFDFVSNLHPPTYPDGNDVEVMSRQALEIAALEAKRPHQREHTTPFLWDQPERFRIGNVAWESGRDLSMSHRFTIDYPEDYQFIRAVFEALWRPEAPIFTLEEILELLERRPDIYALNAGYAGVNWYRNHLDELQTVTAKDTRKP